MKISMVMVSVLKFATLIAADTAGVYDCAATANASLTWDDCNDDDVAINPDGAEVCDGGVDNDCDGLVDDQDDPLDLTTGTMFYADADGDGFGSEATGGLGL